MRHILACSESLRWLSKCGGMEFVGLRTKRPAIVEPTCYATLNVTSDLWLYSVEPHDKFVISVCTVPTAL